MLGQTLSHYRIIEKLGAGGMGVVYRAHDEQLDRDVALKVLPAGTLADENARRQFRQEALALAKLNHPNIETIFEFNSEGGVDFLAMELIAGQSLSDKLHEGPLAAGDIQRLGIQFAEGLAAAHLQGIIHRDIKPGNLFITPDGRLKILDFGLAKIAHPELSTDMTQSFATYSDVISGTVPYMSPEQLRGLPVDTRTDIYAAGAVLYEMATGRRPFPQSKSAELMGAILLQTPPPPSSVNAHVPPGLESVISKALEKDASQRYQSARELRVALEGLGANATGGAASAASIRAARSETPTRGPGVPLYVVGTTLAVVLAAGLVVGLNIRGIRDRVFKHNQPEAPAAAAAAPSGHARRSVAVLGFKNVSGQTDKAWLSTAFSEMLTTELAAGEQLRTVPGESVAQMKISLSLPDAESYGRETLGKIRNNISADAIVLGSYIPLGKGQIRLDLRLQDAVEGETLASVSEKGSEDQIDDLVSRAGEALRQKLGAGSVSVAQAAEVKASLPTNPEAERLYSEGLAKLRAFENVEGRDLLQKAVAAEPGFALSHSALGNAWQILGYDAKAKEEAKKAFDLSANLSRENRLLVEGRYHSIYAQRDKAVETYQTLFQSFPDNLGYGLRLAEEQQSAGKLQDALGTIAQLRKLAAPSRDDPRIDLMEAEVTLNSGDYKRGLAAATQARDKSQAEGAKLVEASAFFYQCIALYNLGQPKEAVAACDGSNRLYGAAGDRFHAASALNTMGNVLRDESKSAEAEPKYQEALRIWRSVGSQEGIAVALANLAMINQDQGKLAAAKPLYEEALTTLLNIGDKQLAGISIGNLGNLLKVEWDLTGAKSRFEQALAIARETGDKDQESTQLLNLANLSIVQGDLKGADAALGQTEVLLHNSGRKYDTASLRSSESLVLYFRGDVAGARAKEQEALKLRNEIDAKGEAANSQVTLADISIEEGHPSDAVAQVRDAIKEFEAEKGNEDSELDSHNTLLNAYLAMGSAPANLQNAEKEVEAGKPLAAKSQNRGARMDYAIASARVQAAKGNLAEAKKNLETGLLQAERMGSIPLQFELRLRLGEVEMKSGKTAAGRARLAALEKDATSKGFLLFARRAHEAGS